MTQYGASRNPASGEVLMAAADIIAPAEVHIPMKSDVEMSDALPAPLATSCTYGPEVYARMKALQRQLEFLEIQEEYIKDEMLNLKRELVRAKEEVKRIQSVPLVIGQFLEIIDHNHGCLLYTSPSPRDLSTSRMPSSA